MFKFKFLISHLLLILLIWLLYSSLYLNCFLAKVFIAKYTELFLFCVLFYILATFGTIGYAQLVANEILLFVFHHLPAPPPTFFRTLFSIFLHSSWRSLYSFCMFSIQNFRCYLKNTPKSLFLLDVAV